MSTPNLAAEIQHLDERLAQVENTLLRLEQLLLNRESQSLPSPDLKPRPKTIRFASPRLRHREQAADFAMIVTRES